MTSDAPTLADAGPDSPPALRGRWLALLLPALAAVVLYLPVLGHGFVYDDAVLIEQNPHIQEWSAAVRGFTMPFWKITGDPRRHGAGFYRPVPIAAFATLWQVGGGEPAAFHATGLLLHAAASLLVAALALRLGWRAAAAGGAGILFAALGAHVEAVAWVSAMPDLLATGFSLAAVLLFLRGRGLPGAACLLLALLSKEAALGAALLCALLAWRHARRPAALLWPAAALLVYYVLRVVAFGGLDAGLAEAVIRGTGFDRLDRGTLSLSLISRYVGFLAWPWPHAPFRPIPLDQADFVRPWLLAALGAGLLLAGAAAVLRRPRWLRVPAGLLLFGLLPVLNVQALGQFPMEERFLYLPSTGFCLLVAGALLGVQVRRAASRPAVAAARTAGWALFGVVLAGNVASLRAALPHWKSDREFFFWAIEASPNAMTSWLGLGAGYMQRAQDLRPGDPAAAEQAALAAEQAFTAGLEIRSNDWFIVDVDRQQGNVGLGNALFLQGDLRTAEDVFTRILRVWPDLVEANLGMGSTLGAQGAQLAAQGEQDAAFARFEDALPFFDKALEVRPDLVEALSGKGSVLAYLEHYGEAAPLLRRAVELRPGQVLYWLDLAEVHMSMGQNYEAVRALEQCLEANPETPLRDRIHAEIERLQGP